MVTGRKEEKNTTIDLSKINLKAMTFRDFETGNRDEQEPWGS